MPALHAGGGSVTVRVRSDELEHAYLEVEDTGPGIAPAERERVFERFYRILGNTAEGSGLGLAIVREIAQQHGAEVDIFNNPRATQAAGRPVPPDLPAAARAARRRRTTALWISPPATNWQRARRLTVALLRCGC
jgi:signal transduction histidine kinase